MTRSAGFSKISSLYSGFTTPGAYQANAIVGSDGTYLTSNNLRETPVSTGNGYTTATWPTTNITATLTLNYYSNHASVPSLSSTPYSAPSGATVQTRG